MDNILIEKPPCPVCKTGVEHIIRESVALTVLRAGKKDTAVVVYLKCPTCLYTWPVSEHLKVQVA